MAEVLDELIVARPCPAGAPCRYSWTLVSYLGAILQEVETKFGPRDPSFTVLGIEFGIANPHIWFPGGGKHVAIQLGSSALSSIDEALFQLAHECVHLLNPVQEASVLEEGLATFFQLEYVHRRNPNHQLSDAKYLAAAGLVKRLLAARSDAIPALRAGTRSLSGVTAADIRAIVTNSTVDADALAHSFGKWQPEELPN